MVLNNSLRIFPIAICVLFSFWSVDVKAQNEKTIIAPVIDLLLNSTDDQTTKFGNFRLKSSVYSLQTTPTGIYQTSTFNYTSLGLQHNISRVGSSFLSGTQSVNTTFNSSSNPSLVAYTGSGSYDSAQTDTFFYNDAVPLVKVETMVESQGMVTNSSYTPQYNNDRLVSAQVIIMSGSTTTTEQHSFTYNASGRISQHLVDRPAGLPDESITYSYATDGFLQSSQRTSGSTVTNVSYAWESVNKHVQTSVTRIDGAIVSRAKIESNYETGPCKILDANSPEIILAVIQTGDPVSTGVNCSQR